MEKQKCVERVFLHEMLYGCLQLYSLEEECRFPTKVKHICTK